MSTIRNKLKEVIDILSELNVAPEPSVPFLKAIDAYIKTLKEAKYRNAKEEASRDLFAELVNVDTEAARQKLDRLTDAEFKNFCAINRIKSVKGKKEKRVKGKVIQKAVKAKAATKKKPAQPAIPEKCEPDTVIPAQTDREATTEAVLNLAFQLKNQSTI